MSTTNPVTQLARVAQTGSPVEQRATLRQLDQMTGNRPASNAIASGDIAGADKMAATAPEMCRGAVRYNLIATTANIATHTYIVMTDNDSTNYFRGGPTEAARMPFSLSCRTAKLKIHS
jgi:hypothetical protein